MNKNLEIQRLRAVAVFMTVVAHCGFIKTILPSVTTEPITGVDLFFVISGFVVTSSLLRSLPDLRQFPSLKQRILASCPTLKNFYLRRIFRILPPAFFWAFVYLAISICFSKNSAYLVGTPEQLLQEIGYFFVGLYNYLISFKSERTVYYIGHYWSLAVEEHFYLLLPIILVFLAKRKSRIFSVLLIIISVAFALRPLIVLSDKMVERSFYLFCSHRRFDTLAIGVLISLLIEPYINKKSILQNLDNNFFIKNFLQFIFLIPLWVAFKVFPEPFKYNLGLTVSGILGGALVFLASLERGFILNYRYIKEVLEFIGERSYTLYLSHTAVISLDILFTNWIELQSSDFHFFLRQNAVGILLHFVILFGISVFISHMAYSLVEKPLIIYAKRRFSANGDSNFINRLL